MVKLIGQPFRFAANWLGGWSRLILLIVVVAGVFGGLMWQNRRQPNIPPEATQVQAQLLGDLRQTNYRYPGSVEQVRAFYQQYLPERGWIYCGTGETEGCSNMRRMAGDTGAAIDVYRRADDTSKTGSTIEIWPQADPNGQAFVTIYETRQQ